MSRLAKVSALPALACFTLLIGVSSAPQPAEAGRFSRAVGTAVAVGVTKSTIRRANAASRDDDDRDDRSSGAVKPVDYDARAQEAKAKLAAEGEGERDAAARAKSAGAMAANVNKIVCVAGCD